MKLFPAIDIRNGKVVRLTKGDYDRMTVYTDSPEMVADSFIAAGASCLHTVDLDGARAGTPENFEVIKRLAAKKQLFIQVGGGIRSMERIESYLQAGINRVILGTVAAQSLDFVKEAVRLYGDAIAVGVDARDGQVAVSGWEVVTDLSSFEFCARLQQAGVQTVIYTDIARDGGLCGTNLEAYRRLSELDGLNIIASGGITFMHELTALRDMGLYGAILGKALYEGKLDLKQAVALAEGGTAAC